jgi:hypothetical protein
VESLPTSRQRWAPHIRRTGRELALYALAGIGIVLVTSLQPFDNEKPKVAEQGQPVQRDHLSLSQRLGYAVLLHADYGTAALVDMEGMPLTDSTRLTEARPRMALLRNDDHPDLKCARGPDDGDFTGSEPVDVPALTIAIAAAERYNRNSFNRMLEAGVARLSLALGGSLPEFTYGAAQIRASTARRLVREELGGFALADRDLLELLTNDCQNLHLAAKYVNELAIRYHDGGKTDEIISRVATRYNGMATPNVNGFLYRDAVLGAYHLLTQGEARGEDDETGDRKRFCVFFALGEAIGDSLAIRNGTADVLGEAGVSSTDSASVVMTNLEPGPAAYRQRLWRARGGWISRELRSLGFGSGAITLVDRGNAADREEEKQNSDSGCEADRLTSFAMVTIQHDTTLNRKAHTPPATPVAAAAVQP